MPRALWLAEARATLALAAPLAGAQLAQFALTVVDTILMGRLSPQALAAGTLVGALFWVPGFLCVGVLTAVSPLVAEAHGARQRRAIARTVRQGLWAATLIGVPSVLALWNTEAILLLFGQEKANAALAQSYMRPLVMSFVPMMWFAVLRQFIAALGHARVVLAIALGGIALNALLAWALMFGRLGLPALGLPGAGIATTLVNFAMLASIAAYITRTRALARCHVLARVWRGDWPKLAAIFRIGLPIGGALLAEVGLFSAGSLLVGLFGTEALAAHGIALLWASLAFMLPMGIAQAATIRIGIASGAGSRAGIARAGAIAYLLGIGMSLASALLFLSAPALLIGLFLDQSQANVATVIELGVAFLSIAALFQLADGAQAIGHGVLRGIKDTRLPSLISVFGYFAIGLGAAALLAFPFGWGALGVWVGQALGLATVALLLLLRFARQAWVGGDAWR